MEGASTLWNPLAHRRGELLSETLAPDVLADRWARRYDGMIGEINRWVDHVRATTYENVPYADPAAANEGARVLVLLRDPSSDAANGSGFVSKHENDVTAHTIYRVTERADLDYRAMLLWNVVPWSVTHPARPPRSLLREAVRAQPYLAEMFHRLDPPPTEVVLMGRAAGRAWDRLVRLGRPDALADVTVSRCPHPSPLVYPRHEGTTGRSHGDLMVEALRTAGQRSRGEPVRPPAGGPAGRRRPF